MNDLFLLILSILSCYLIGSISFGRIISKLSKNVDITSQGSGNTGATNVLRSIGVSYGLLVLFLDMVKSIIPVLIIENYEFGSINYATQIAALSAITISSGSIFIFSATLSFTILKGAKG